MGAVLWHARSMRSPKLADRSLVALLLCNAIACRGQSVTSPTRALRVETSEPGVSAALAPARLPEPLAPLPKDATFADLVRRVRHAGSSAISSCLVGGDERSLRLETYEAPTRLFDDPPADLDPLPRKSSPGSDCSRHGGKQETLKTRTWILLALTPASRVVRDDVAPVLVVTDKAMYLGSLGFGGFEHRPDSIADLLAKGLPVARVWIVAAESNVSLSKLEDALALLKTAKGTVVLATPLPAPVQGLLSPSEAKRQRLEPGALFECKSFDYSGDLAGLPIGAYTPSHLYDAIDVLKHDVMACERGLAPVGGGTIEVHVAVNPDGKPAKACVSGDDIGDLAVRRCVVEATLGASLPRPDKAGWNYFGASFMLAGRPIRALCDAP